MDLTVPSSIRVLLSTGTVSELKMETYLAGVVAAEMGATAPLEALKAQAVASRTYAVSAHRHPESGADVCTTSHCQKWRRVDPIIAPEVFRAVSETWGMIAMHDGKLIDAFFFEHCDGHTRNAQDLLMPAVPYLQSVECECGFIAMKGHGVGLCQRGAIVMARRGVSFERILRYYYYGITIVSTSRERIETTKPEPPPTTRLTGKKAATGAKRVKPKISHRVPRSRAEPEPEPDQPIRPPKQEIDLPPIGIRLAPPSHAIEPPPARPPDPATKREPDEIAPAPTHDAPDESLASVPPTVEPAPIQATPVEPPTTEPAAEATIAEPEAPALAPNKAPEPVAEEARPVERAAPATAAEPAPVGIIASAIEPRAPTVEPAAVEPEPAHEESVASIPAETPPIILEPEPETAGQEPIPPVEAEIPATVFEVSVEPETAQEQIAAPAAETPVPAAPVAPEPVEPVEVPSYVEQLNTGIISDAAEPASVPAMDASMLPSLSEESGCLPERVHVDHLPGARMIAGCLNCAGVVVTIEDSCGNKTLVFSGSAPHYGEGGFETMLDEDGRYIVSIEEQEIAVDVQGDTVFIHA